jgi:hypothetical protein
MGRNAKRLLERENVDGVLSGACVGRIDRIDANGDVFVDFRGNRLGPIPARVATTAELRGTAQLVLLVFEDADPDLPVIAGVVRPGIRGQEPRRSLTLEAADEITITCGKSSITLRRDGRVTIKGTELVSRASGTNKVRGAVVKIN